MNGWWETLLLDEKIYWLIAIPFTVMCAVLVIAMIMGISGEGFDFGGDTEVSLDEVAGGADGDLVPLGKRIFGFRNIVYFFTFLSWSGIVNRRAGTGSLMTFIISIVIASVGVGILVACMSFLMKASANGIMDKNNAIGKIGKVYLKIPKQGEGMGKVEVMFQGSLRELDVISENEEISTGEEVEIIGVREDGVLVAKKIILIEER